MLFLIERDWPKKKKGPPKDFPHIYLTRDNWNDFGYRTTCDVDIQYSQDGERINLGGTRIMRRGQEIGPWVFTEGPEEFHSLDDLNGDHCSLSQDRKFYESLIEQGLDVARQVLRDLNDAIFSSTIWANFEDDPVFRTSLLREASWIMEQRDSIRKELQIKARRHFNFSYTTLLPGTTHPVIIPFIFKPRSPIPSRINLIVGANGAGKTQVLARLAIAMCGYTRESEGGQNDEVAQKYGRRKREQAGTLKPIPSIYRVVSISFNPFDQFEIPTQSKDAKFEYTYCGIRSEQGQIISQDQLVENLVGLGENLDENRRTLLEDTVSDVLGIEDPSPYFGTFAEENYSKLSAGQKILLNILSHLIANLKELTLVLIDEPETHLHPTLITTLMDKLHELLQTYNAFSIIASHSPIVAQQIPSQFVKVMWRDTAGFVGIERPQVETFGETLSELTNALFDAREYERDYTAVLDKLLKKHGEDPGEVESLFEGLGSNALRYLYASSRQIKK